MLQPLLFSVAQNLANQDTPAALTGTYVACLDCGKEFAYDWQQMKVITSPERHRERLAELAKHAV